MKRDDLAAAATASDRVFALNYPKRREESFQIVRDLVHRRELGSLNR